MRTPRCTPCRERTRCAGCSTGSGREPSRVSGGHCGRALCVAAGCAAATPGSPKARPPFWRKHWRCCRRGGNSGVCGLTAGSLIDVPGYTFRIWVTDRTDEPLVLWRDYNGRAAIEQRIEKLKNDLAAGDFCTQNFWATEAAFLAVLLSFNLLSLYQQNTTPTPAIASPPPCGPRCSCAAQSWAGAAERQCCICRGLGRIG